MISEVLQMRNFKGTILNSKQEYLQCLIPKFYVKSIRNESAKKSKSKSSEICPDQQNMNKSDTTDESYNVHQNMTKSENVPEIYPDLQKIIEKFERPFLESR